MGIDIKRIIKQKERYGLDKKARAKIIIEQLNASRRRNEKALVHAETGNFDVKFEKDINYINMLISKLINDIDREVKREVC